MKTCLKCSANVDNAKEVISTLQLYVPDACQNVSKSLREDFCFIFRFFLFFFILRHEI